MPENEWQKNILGLLRLRYGYELVEVPDRDGGDGGIEAFSRDGCSYQCYAPDEPLSTAERYQKHRDKMTNDLNKFKRNGRLLASLLGSVKIKRWVFAIPVHDSKDLVSHSQAKAAEIRSLNLPYVADDFEITIVTEDAFDVERRIRLREGLQQLNLPAKEVPDDTLRTFAEANSSQIERLNKKIAKIALPENRSQLKNLQLQTYLNGEEALSRLRAYPEIYEAFVALRNNRARFVAMKSLTQSGPSSQLLDATIKEFVAEVRSSIVALGAQTAELLAYAASIGWLLECQLDFPDSATTDTKVNDGAR